MLKPVQITGSFPLVQYSTATVEMHWPDSLSGSAHHSSCILFEGTCVLGSPSYTSSKNRRPVTGLNPLHMVMTHSDQQVCVEFIEQSWPLVYNCCNKREKELKWWWKPFEKCIESHNVHNLSKDTKLGKKERENRSDQEGTGRFSLLWMLLRGILGNGSLQFKLWFVCKWTKWGKSWIASRPWEHVVQSVDRPT